MATRQDHARSIAVACNNLNPGSDIIAALVGWSLRETGGTPRPKNNMLASGQKEVGSTDFNSIVQNYLTIGDEGSAIATNLSEGFDGYKELKAAIAGGYWDASVKQGLITWVGHDAYGSQYASFISDGLAHLNDDYDTGAGGGIGSNINSSPTNPMDDITKLLTLLAAPLLNAGQFFQALSNLSKDPIRIAKFVTGLLVFGVGLLMVFVDVIEMVSNSQAGQAIKKTTATVGKMVAA